MHIHGDTVLPIIENHPSIAGHYCPMCGAEKEDGYDDLQGHRLAADALRKLCRLHIFSPAQAKVVSLCVVFPQMSIRDMATAIGKSKSRTAEIIDEVLEHFPEAASLLGKKSTAAIGQQRRRERQHGKG